MGPEWIAEPGDADRALSAALDASGAVAWDATERSETSGRLRERLAGFARRVGETGPILIKTSTAGSRGLDHEPSAELVGFVIESLRASFPARALMLADGTAYGDSYAAIAERAGWFEAARAHGVAVLDLNAADPVEIAPGWPIARPFLEAAAVVNLTKAKTHRKFGASLALKSLLGVVVGGRTGYPKLLGRHERAAWLMSALEARSPVALSIIDGVRGIGGEGPLDGQPTRSRFMVAGEGYLGPDVQAVVEMGFDPLLVPLFLRPLARATGAAPVSWARRRVTHCDFLPSVSCSWMYRSLRNSKHRAERYAALLAGAMAAWSDPGRSER